MIVAEVSYEVTDPTVDFQIVKLKASGADTSSSTSPPAPSSRPRRSARLAEIGWKPMHILNSCLDLHRRGDEAGGP